MSGGGNKKKSAQSQGWEEAGSEFYQESYPLDSEIEVLQRDPRRLATLLPSKQTRAAIATIKISRTAARKRTATRGRGGGGAEEGTAPRRRASQVGDVQVAMMPDLSEMQSNEKTAWEEVMQLKAMPVPMAQKKEMKAKILNEPNLRLQGYEQFRWRRRKTWDRITARLRELAGRLVLWRGSMKHIEGNFGTGVVALFLFVRWLLLLNLAISTLVLAFVALPAALLEGNAGICNDGNGTECCAAEYFDYSSTGGVGDVILEALQGAGMVERTVVFYGYYRDGVTGYYDASLAYLFTALACLVLSLAAVVRSAAGGFRERLVEGEGQFYKYCDLILGGWDFCIDNARAAEAKRRALHGELRAQLETERAEEERRGRTRREKYRTYSARLAVNVAVMAMLAGAGFAIYLVFRRSTEALREFETGDKSAEQLLYEFLPSMTIVALNVALPFLFKYLIKFERYSPNFELRLSLVRTVFLRLASLIVLYVSLLTKVACSDDETMASGCVACASSPTCWETFVGQQVLKLILTDFGAHVLLTFLVNLPRSLMAQHVGGRVCAALGAQTFDLPKHSLDVVYIQTLSWFGTFYAPLLPILTTIILFLLFYVKKFACLVNSRPDATIYRASRSKSMFMLVALVSYACAVLPVAYSIAELRPSRACGPFRRFETVWYCASDLFSSAPSWMRGTFFFVGTAGFAVPCFVVLLFLLYYYSAIGSANRHMVAVLKNQLVLEGHDKQFLLDRLSLFIRQESVKGGPRDDERDAN